jgi:hypothetical protein
MYSPPSLGGGEFQAICGNAVISEKSADCDGSTDCDPYSAPIRDGERNESAAIG